LEGRFRNSQRWAKQLQRGATDESSLAVESPITFEEDGRDPKFVCCPESVLEQARSDTLTLALRHHGERSEHQRVHQPASGVDPRLAQLHMPDDAIVERHQADPRGAGGVEGADHLDHRAIGTLFERGGNDRLDRGLL